MGGIEQISLVRAVLGTSRRGGKWEPRPHIVATAQFGVVVLDLREAVLPAMQLDITADAFCGTVDITVPADAVVTDCGTAFLGDRTLPRCGTDGDRRTSLPIGEPGLVIRLTGHAAFGRVRVRRPTRWPVRR